MKKIYIVIFGLLFSLMSCSGDKSQKEQHVYSLKAESFKTLSVLAKSLQEKQVKDTKHEHFGAIACESCNVYHTRAAEMVFPFAKMYEMTGDESFKKSAIDLGNWLIKQQEAGGEWKETPEEWTGTTTDQLLMMIFAWEILKDDMDEATRINWENSMKAAGDFLVREMSPDFASINYCATTTATMAHLFRVFGDQKWADKGKELTYQTLAKMDDDGFIFGEGDRFYGIKYGADVGYELDMSLWALKMYGDIMGDEFVQSKIKNAVETHLPFIYPSGVVDGSWGIRSNKWCTFGSETADGCQTLFVQFAEEDPVYLTAALRNLEYLNTNIQNGLVGYGPHYFDIFTDSPCIYPSFVRSKNLAMTIAFDPKDVTELPELPSDKKNWMKFYPSVNVALIRTESYYTTVTAYNYKSIDKRFKSKYMHRPAGGAISNLYIDDYGHLLFSSQTEYHRWEPMHFPVVENVGAITSRIEFRDDDGFFTNLYDFDANIFTSERNNIFFVNTNGELSDKKFRAGGVSFIQNYEFHSTRIQKNIRLRYNGKRPDISLVEPVVLTESMKIQKIDDKTVTVTTDSKSFTFHILSDAGVYRDVDETQTVNSVFPSIKAIPITIFVPAPEDFTQLESSVQYEIIINN